MRMDKRNDSKQRLAIEAAEEYVPDMGQDFVGETADPNGSIDVRSDVLGSYTGIAMNGAPFDPLDMVYLDDPTPEQDADDL